MICQVSPPQVTAPHSSPTTAPPPINGTPQTIAPQHPKWNKKCLSRPSSSPWFQHSTTSGGTCPLLWTHGRLHQTSSIEQHLCITDQHHTIHGQSSESVPQLCYHPFRGHYKIPHKWNGPTHPQRRLLLVRSWIQVQIKKISLPHHKIIGYQKVLTKSDTNKWTSTYLIYNHVQHPCQRGIIIIGRPFC